MAKVDLNEARTAVIYARFSCSKQREASIEDQLRVCRSWCEREGYEVVGEYCDHAISGRTDERPEFQRMIDNAGESGIVLVYMMDRFSRDAYDAPLYKKRLRDRGVRVLSATEAIPDTPEAVLIEKMYEGLAAVESAHIAERTKRGMTGNALKCMHNGVPVFGYDFGDDGHYVVNPGEAEIVRECFARKLEGESTNSIARDLARRGVRTTSGSPAAYSFVHGILKNEKYVGTYVWGDIRVEGGMPAIVEEGDFAMAQTVRPRKVRANEEWGDFALAGKAICEGCGRNLVGVSGHGRSGARYDYYRCGRKCGVKAIRADLLEAKVVDALRTILADRERSLEVARAVARYIDNGANERRVKSAKKRAREAESAIRNLTRAVAQGMDYDDVKDDVQAYKSALAAAEAEAALYESAETFDPEDFADFLQHGATLDDRHLLDAFVAQVMVGDEDVTVLLNYDVKKFEPARLSLKRVRTDLVWLPTGRDVRTVRFAACDKFVLVRFPRAA